MIHVIKPIEGISLVTSDDLRALPRHADLTFSTDRQKISSHTFAMPVTIKTAPHESIKFKQQISDDLNDKLFSADTFFRWDDTFQRYGKTVMASSFNPAQNVKYQHNGFVHTVIQAYNEHYDLVIRPDDVWISILAQLSSHINSNAEELREKFVAHDKKKALIIKLESIEPDEIDWEEFANQMTELMDQDLVDKDLKQWILPDFSTTTQMDTNVSAMLMMACMKNYYYFIGMLMCGIPTVTLDGTKEDWLEIQTRLTKLDTWDDITRKWQSMLKPIIKKFIAAFDGEVDTDFWEHVVSNERIGSGSTAVAGWITAFCAFNLHGRFIDEFGYHAGGRRSREFNPYVLDGVSYPMINKAEIPCGTADVDVHLLDEDGRLVYETVLFAGNMGMRVTPGEGGKGDTVQNVPMWCCCLKDQEKVEQVKREQKQEKEVLEKIKKMKEKSCA